MSRELDAAVRRAADADTDRINDALPRGERVVATLTGILPGAGTDGQDVVKVTYRGRELTANGRNKAYTPTVGDRVICDFLADGQVYVDYSPCGFPA